MKTIGVLGGLGPQATIDFEIRLHRAAQRLMPQQFGNAGYPPMVVWYCRHAPVLVDEHFAPVLPIQPDPRLFEAAARLGTLADFLVITSNGVHFFADEIARAAGRPVLNMVHLALGEARRRGWRRVGVLGMGEPKVYTGATGASGESGASTSLDIEWSILPAADRDRLDRVILGFMAGHDDGAARVVVTSAVEQLRRTGVDGVILGCTELPLLLGSAADADDLINPGVLLAEAAVREAMGS